jgi:hypothetical protein
LLGDYAQVTQFSTGAALPFGDTDPEEAQLSKRLPQRPIQAGARRFPRRRQRIGLLSQQFAHRVGKLALLISLCQRHLSLLHLLYNRIDSSFEYATGRGSA